MTTRDHSFAPRDELFGVPLGTHPASDYGHFTLGADVTSWKGPGVDYFYSEGHALNGSNGGKMLVLSASAAGLGQAAAATDFPFVLCGRPLCPVPSDAAADLSRLRERLRVTTYTVIDVDRLPLRALPATGDFRFGPDWDTVASIPRAREGT
jgi:hypothetical protein